MPTDEPLDLPFRPRRLRRTPAIRALVRETRLGVDNLIQPLFVTEGDGEPEPIATMPGQFRWPVRHLVEECRILAGLGVPAVNLFGNCTRKDDQATEAVNPDGLVPRAIRALKAAVPGLCVQTDLALDPYASHGHDGLVIGGEVANDATVAVLREMARVHAEAGVDWVAPSDMMDGRVAAIRDTLDEAGHTGVGILAYSAKYASCFYGPFRGALDSAPRHGDKKTYQMDPANVREALREIELDIEEGADVVMVKPGLPCLDVIRAARDAFDIPIAAYQVSGEYGMILAAAEKGWMDADTAMLETLTALRRAGADMILTYFARRVAEHLRGTAP